MNAIIETSKAGSVLGLMIKRSKELCDRNESNRSVGCLICVLLVSCFGFACKRSGRLAAVSNLKWERVVKWLTSGRPLSLVALDALIACWHYNTPILIRFAPKLLEPAPVDEMNATLDDYLDRDPVPRVRKAVLAIRVNWEHILTSQPDI